MLKNSLKLAQCWHDNSSTALKNVFLNYTLVLSWDYDLVMNLIWYIRVDFAGDVKWSYTVNIVQIWMRFWWENLNLIFIYDYMYSFI